MKNPRKSQGLAGGYLTIKNSVLHDTATDLEDGEEVEAVAPKDILGEAKINKRRVTPNYKLINVRRIIIFLLFQFYNSRSVLFDSYVSVMILFILVLCKMVLFMCFVLLSWGRENLDFFSTLR